MSLEIVIKDIKDAQARAKKKSGGGALDAKHEVTANLYPLLLALAEATKGDVDEIGGALDDLLDDEGSVIQPELAAVLFAHVQLSRELIAEVRKLKMDDVTKKKVEDMCQAVEKVAGQAEEGVGEAAVELEGGPEESEEPEEDDEDEDDEEPGKGDESDDDNDDDQPAA